MCGSLSVPGCVESLNTALNFLSVGYSSAWRTSLNVRIVRLPGRIRPVIWSGADFVRIHSAAWVLCIPSTAEKYRSCFIFVSVIILLSRAIRSSVLSLDASVLFHSSCRSLYLTMYAKPFSVRMSCLRYTSPPPSNHSLNHVVGLSLPGLIRVAFGPGLSSRHICFNVVSCLVGMSSSESFYAGGGEMQWSGRYCCWTVLVVIERQRTLSHCMTINSASVPNSRFGVSFKCKKLPMMLFIML